MRKCVRLITIVCSLISWGGCAGCPRRGDDVTSVTSGPVTLQRPRTVAETAPSRRPAEPPTPRPAAEAPVASPPAAPAQDLLSTLVKSGPPPVPPNSYVAEDLTRRLREKMAESFGGDLAKVPDAKIYLGVEGLEQFVKFYEPRGYRIQRMTIPASQIIQAAMRERTELATRIDLKDYEGVMIEQVIVEGTGVSAANKYIDPDTFQVIDKLFITVMPLK